MDGDKDTQGAAQDQDARRASAIRDFEDYLDRAPDDLEFKILKVISYAIHDAAGDDPSAKSNASFTAEGSAERVFQEQRWKLKRAWRPFLQVLP